MSSSIFSFDWLKSLSKQSPKQTLLYLLFCFGTVATIVGSNFVLEHLDPRFPHYDYNYEGLKLMNDETRALFVGSSRVNSAVNPAWIDHPVASLAFDGVDYSGQLELVKVVIDRMENLEVVFLDASYISVYQPTDPARNQNYDSLLRIGLSVWDIPAVSFERKLGYWFKNIPFTRHLTRGPKLSWDNVKTYWDKGRGSQTSPVRYPGFHAKDKPSNLYSGARRNNHLEHGDFSFHYVASDPIPEFIERPYLHNTLSAEAYDAIDINLPAWFEMIRLFQERGIKVIFITFPFHIDGASSLEDQLRETKEMMDVASGALTQESMLWNFFHDKRFHNDEFDDAYHLNYKGAQRFASILNELIKDHEVL